MFEVHGHLRTARCCECQTRFPLSAAFDQVRSGHLPECEGCGESLRPDVVLFGDMMPDAFTQASDAAAKCGLLLVVGSSLTVSPANTLAMMSRRLAIINRDPTPLDDRAIVVIHAAAGETLAALADKLGA